MNPPSSVQVDSTTNKTMNGFNYNNIFETKGLEYLVVIAFLVLLIPFWLLLNKKARIALPRRKASGILNLRTLNIPMGVFFSRYHTWTHLEMTGVAKVGLDDLLVHITGDVKFNPLRKPGEKISKGEILAEIDHHGKTLSIHSPLSGEILDRNDKLTNNPEMVKADPYKVGWMYKIKPERWKDDIRSCLLAEDALGWMDQELEKLKDFMTKAAARSPESGKMILQDGGELVDQPLSNLPVEYWNDFQQIFLNQTETL
jgi:glycine cleavage system H protein